MKQIDEVKIAQEITNSLHGSGDFVLTVDSGSKKANSLDADQEVGTSVTCKNNLGHILSLPQKEFEEYIDEYYKFDMDQKDNIVSLAADHISAAYMAMIDDVKKDCQITYEESADYYFEAIFVLMVQTFVCIFCLHFGELLVPDNLKDFDIEYTKNLCMFFSNMVLHFAVLQNGRNGIYMMNFIVHNPNKFSSLPASFSLGFFTFMVSILIETTNIIYSNSRSSIPDIVGAFVGFKMLIDVLGFYLKAKQGIKSNKAVGSKKLHIRGEYVKIKRQGGFHTICVGLYKFSMVIFSSLYIYFMPFLIIAWPINEFFFDD